MEDILEFFNSEPTGNIDITIMKLEMIRDMFENKLGEELPQFRELVEAARHTKETIENSKAISEEIDEEDLYESYFDDNLPRHFYGEEGELIFEE